MLLASIVPYCPNRIYVSGHEPQGMSEIWVAGITLDYIYELAEFVFSRVAWRD